MRSLWSLGLAFLLALTSRARGLDIPLEVEQLPTITVQTPGPVIAFPFEDSFSMRCEAKGNPQPVYRWTKDGQAIEPLFDLGVKKERNNGSFVIHSGHLAQFQGKYQCYASNNLGTAVSEEIELIVPSTPKFPKEKIAPIVVKEGQPVILECNPPQGIPPRQIYWMTIGLQHIEQDERVSMGQDGNLYFSNALEKDSRRDYCCFAAFSAIRTIVQKTAMSVVVKSLKPAGELDDSDSSVDGYAIPERKPSLLVPSGGQSEVWLVKGEELVLECIAEGFPTPVIEWKLFGEKLPKRANIKNYGKCLTINNIEEEDDGKYMCTARNSVGQTVHYFSVMVEEPPRWQPEPPKGQLAVVGSDVHIKCSASGKPWPVISWRRNGQPLDDGPSSNRQVLDDTIVLHRARPEDSAVYQCEVSNRHGTILANINIMIINLPPRMLTKDYQRYSVVQGRDILMDCKVFSSPPSTVSWNKDETTESVEGEQFSVFKNGSLQINQAGKEDSGEYMCFATNSEGKSAITALLDVKDPTQIVEPPQNLLILSGTTAQLTCQAEYDISLRKEFQIVWSKDGEQIPPFTEQSRYFLDNGMLHIINVNQSDKGTYTCIARTNLDQDTASALVTVLDVPDAPEDVELSEQKSWSVRLAWVPGDDHNSSATEFIVEYEESQWDPGTWRELKRVPGNQATAVLTLHGHLNYQFRVYAVNAIGTGPPSKPTDRYKTPSAAPYKNPENIKIQGHLPHQMDISWEPLLPVEHNGPGLEYKVSYRKLGVEDVWKEHLVKRHAFVIKNTPTFVPYEIKIQSRNSHGWGPEPKVVTGYSGEDLPTAAPRDVAVEVLNTTLLRVSWTRVAQATVRGHLGGYNVHWLRKRSLLHSNRIPEERHFLTFPGNRSHAMVTGLRPFSEYRLTVNVFNKRGNGPNSDPVTFQTPEGVPEQVPILTVSNAQRDSITLVWAPPFEANGILTGYLLQYQLINETLAVGDMQEVNVSSADTTQWLLQGLGEMSEYMFYLSACTRVGCGPQRMEEGSMVTEANFSSTPAVAPTERRQNCSLIPPSSIPVNATLSSLVPALLNISSYVSDTFAKISWTARDEQQDSQLYVAYMNNREGNWRISEAVNTSKNFHMIEGLEPGTVYTVRLMAKSWLDNASIFEDIIQTRVKGLASLHGGVSTQGWFIGMMCAMALLTLTVLIACFVTRNKGGKYAVKEKEDLHPEVESQGMNDDIFCDYRKPYMHALFLDQHRNESSQQFAAK
ncbi:neural cell adhesion molecule L1-like protein isoform X3 [Coregonus clupeaformis]|uniref:neural cell adhesion molecule L1-like protein isoform X3 n=1 Tax=Coregonus clupeaformis TaxID=59861 RepID=UPI001BDFBEEC|nr:neural cell adhesion molecule L1-like protein isoform X3 [Coregonus clupeaformis]